MTVVAIASVLAVAGVLCWVKLIAPLARLLEFSGELEEEDLTFPEPPPEPVPSPPTTRAA